MNGIGAMALCIVPLLIWTAFIWWLSRFTLTHRIVSTSAISEDRIPLAPPRPAPVARAVPAEQPIRRLPQ